MVQERKGHSTGGQFRDQRNEEQRAKIEKNIQQLEIRPDLRRI
jgi:hypothetical protein